MQEGDREAGSWMIQQFEMLSVAQLLPGFENFFEAGGGKW